VSKSKRKQAARRGRAAIQEPWWRRVPLMPVVTAAVIVVAAIGAIVYGRTYASSSSQGGAVDGIPCQVGEQVAVHYHAHVSIYVNGTPAVIPAGAGIDSSTQCFYWMHTHATDGVIHIEAPKDQAKRNFTLGNFFDIWKKPLSKTQVGEHSLQKGETMVVTVNGKPYSGNPRDIVLHAHDQVVIEVLPPAPSPEPTPFTFPAGL
jgi:hypothetical protein